MRRTNRTSARWTTSFAAAASIAIASTAFAQTAPPPQGAPPAQTVPPGQPAAAADPDLAKQHLTAARNTLSELTQLPAAVQLTGDARLQVQQLISNFNVLITRNAEWRAAYAKVESNLAALLEPQEPVRASGTPGAVGTSGAAGAITLDPAIRAKLTEFRTHLDQFEAVVDGGAPASPSPASPAEPAMATPPAAATTPPAAMTTPPAATASTAAAEARPDSPAPEPAADSAQQITVTPRELLLHVEALEVILGAQATAQAAATSAAGGAVTSSPTVSGSTRTTMTGPDVTLNAKQLDQVRTHLKELRRLLEKK